MKTREEILKDKYIINTNGKDIVFDDDTPKGIALKLVELYNTKQRIRLDYGDTDTNTSWNEEFGVTGRVGLSKGYYDLHYPILVHNKRSLGGSSILTTCIIGIYNSKGGTPIFQI